MSALKSNFSNYFLVYLVVGLAVLETCSGTFVIHESSYLTSASVTYFVSGILLSFLVLVKIGINNPKTNKFSSILSTVFFRKYCSQINFLFLTFTIAFVHFIPIVNQYLRKVPVDYKNADMVPILKTQAHRFLVGEKIYAIIPEIWGGMRPIYLTFMWLPITVSEYFNFDARWMVSLWIALGVYFCLSLTQFSKIKPASFIGAFGLFLAINYMVTKDRPTITLTEEGIVMGYYLFLGYALSRKNPLMISLGIVFCVLSRYILVFWLPVFWLYWYLFQSKKQAGYILGISSALILVTFLLPFGFKDYKFFLNLHQGYIEMAQRNWRGDPEFTWKTLGLAKYFDIIQIPLLHQILLVSSFLAPVIYFIVFWVFRNKRKINSEIFALGSLKLTLVFFFNFLEMPYFYLFYTNTFFSYCLLFNYLKLVEIKELSIIL